MTYYGNNDYRDYLSHHGILGMKWGKRNGPPYPLSPSAHSASEKKAGWKDSLNGGGTKKLTAAEKRAKSVANVRVKNEQYDEEEVKKLKVTKQAFKALSDARKAYADAHKLSTEFNNLSDKEKDKYARKAADLWTTPEYRHDDEPEMSAKDYWKLQYEYIKDNESGHGVDATFNEFAKEKGSSYVKEYHKHWEAVGQYNQAQEKVINDLIGQYGDMKLINYKEYVVYKPSGFLKKKKPHKYSKAPTVKKVLHDVIKDMSNASIAESGGHFVEGYDYNDLRTR